MANIELIGICEAARRLGVSDTAVHKGIKSGRVQVHSRHPGNGRPQLAWPDFQIQWMANSDTSKRSHVGSRGGVNRQANEGKVLATSDRMDEQEIVDAPASGPASGRGGDYTQSRAKREFYQAELARLEFEKESGRLVDAEESRAEGTKLAAAVISALYTIPDRISDELAGMGDPYEIQRLLTKELDRCVEDLRKQYGSTDV